MSEDGPAGALGRKIGPLPAGAWVAAIVAGVGIAWYLRGKSPASSATSATDGTGDFGQGLDNTMPGAGNLAGVDSNPTASLGLDGGYAAYPDNDSWASAAWMRMYAKGYAALATKQALDAYLNGSQLTASQAAMIDVAIQLTGPPPITPPQPDEGQTPAPVPPASGNPNQYPPTRHSGSVLGAVATSPGPVYQAPAHGGTTPGGTVAGPVHGTHL